jgi:membrane-associated phospholipid phosphatase
MPAVVVVAVVWFGAVIVLSALGLAMAPRLSSASRPGGKRGRLSDAVDSSTGRFGRIPTAAVFLVTGTLFTLGLGFVIGNIAHALEDRVDWPVFRWWESRQISSWEGIEWAHVWRDLTSIGSPVLTQDMTLIGGVVLALLWCRRQWWAPPLVLGLAYVIEKYGQILLKHAVHRGHPPTTLGTFPSGGCARVLCVYGLIIFVTLRWWRPESRRPWVAGAALLGFVLSIQAYARIYNLEHWLTDVLGGIIYGLMLLVMMIGLFEILVRDRLPSPRVVDQVAGTGRSQSGDRPSGTAAMVSRSAEGQAG